MNNQEKLFEYGKNLSSGLNNEEFWPGFLIHAIKNNVVITTGEVDILAYGFQVGASDDE